MRRMLGTDYPPRDSHCVPSPSVSSDRSAGGVATPATSRSPGGSSHLEEMSSWMQGRSGANVGSGPRGHAAEGMASVPADGYAACWCRGRGGALTCAWGSPKCRCPRTSEVGAGMRTGLRRCSHVRADRGRACQRGRGRRHVRLPCRWEYRCEQWRGQCAGASLGARSVFGETEAAIAVTCLWSSAAVPLSASASS